LWTINGINERKKDDGKEKHAPIVEKIERNIEIKVELYLIQWKITII